MNEWKNIITDGLNKGVDIAQDILISRYKHLIEWCRETGNKKRLTGAVVSWLFAFGVIICICRVSNFNDVSVSADEGVQEEVESSIETSHKDKILVQDTSAKPQEITTTASAQESEVSETMEQATTVQEKETIDISKLQVSNTPIADDKERVNNSAFISAADVKTISSANFDKTQFSYGIDISYHQGRIDWAKVKAAGVDFAFIRVGNRGYETGKLCKDTRFDENIRGALANGIQVGVYFFSQATTEAEALEEASLTLNWIKGYDVTLPVVIDWETDVGYRTYSGLNATKLTNILSMFCDTISRYGYEPMVYMCKDDFVNRIHTKTITAKYQTWVAWYFKEYRNSDYSRNIFKYGDLLPDMSFDYRVWQYSDRGQVDGIKEPVDMNIMRLPKKVYEVKLETKKASFITNVGTSIDMMEGVSASDSSGQSALSFVQVSLYDSSGRQLDADNAFAKAGTYRIQYYFKDINGTERKREAVLYVRDVPEMYYDGVLWNRDDVKTIEYHYYEELSTEENYQKIFELLQTKCSSIYYDTVAGVSEKYQIQNLTIQGMGNIISDEIIEEKTVNIVYIAQDKSGLESTRKCRLVIKRNRVNEQTSEEQTEKEETKDTNVQETSDDKETLPVDTDVIS